MHPKRHSSPGSDTCATTTAARALHEGIVRAGTAAFPFPPFILVGTILGWSMLIDWLTYAFPALQKLLEPPPLLLIDDGRVLWRHLRHEFVSETELRSKLREHGIAGPSEVHKAYMEPDGQITVVKKNR